MSVVYLDLEQSVKIYEALQRQVRFEQCAEHDGPRFWASDAVLRSCPSLRGIVFETRITEEAA